MGSLMVLFYKRPLLTSLLGSHEGERLENEVLFVVAVVLEADVGLIPRF